MEASDILKIVAFVAFLVLSSVLDSKKKKRKAEEARRRQEQQTKDVSEEEMDDYLDEIRRMLNVEEAKPQAKQVYESVEAEPASVPYHYEEMPKPQDEGTPATFGQSYSAKVDADYFNRLHQRLRRGYEMLETKTDAIYDLEHQEKEKEVARKRTQIDLRQAIIHQAILERKYE